MTHTANIAAKGDSTPDTAPRHPPVRVAPDTWIIQGTWGEGTAPHVVHMNSMVIRGAEPIVVDTGCPIHRDRYLDDLFSLVEPEDVRWVFLSHDDVDHSGNLHEVIDACPQATLIATWFLCERLSLGRLDVPRLRWRWVGDGEAFDAGDRTMLAVRPPLYDSPTTRGLFDTSTGVYWAADCYATPVPTATAFADELDRGQWTDGFNAFQHWNSPWVALTDPDRFADQCRRIEQLDPNTIAGAHGPAITRPDLPFAFELLRRVPTSSEPVQPGQPVLDQIVASMTLPKTASAPTKHNDLAATTFGL